MPEPVTGNRTDRKSSTDVWWTLLSTAIGIAIFIAGGFGFLFTGKIVIHRLYAAHPLAGLIVILAMFLLPLIPLALALMYLKRKMTKDVLDPNLEELVPGREDVSPPSECREWAEQMGFEPVGIFRQTKSVLPIAAWRAPDRPTFFSCLFRDEHASLEFVTRFRDGITLVTGNAGVVRSAGPDWTLFAQTYSRTSPEDLWQRHVEAEEYLTETGGAEFAETEARFPDWFAEYRRKQIARLPRIPFNPFGFAARVRKFHHLSIRKQHERSMIRLPNEL